MSPINPTGNARPINPLPLPEADLYAAVREFVLTYAQPPLEPDNVFQGWQNRSFLPMESNDYAVMSIVSVDQHGTNLEHFHAANPEPSAPGSLQVQGLFKIGVRLEFCGDDDSARLRAQRLAVLGRSSIGAQFFKEIKDNPCGLSLLYAAPVSEEAFEDEARQFVRRYCTTLYLSAWSGVSVDFDYFDNACLSRLENVDAHHPNQE